SSIIVGPVADVGRRTESPALACYGFATVSTWLSAPQSSLKLPGKITAHGLKLVGCCRFHCRDATSTGGRFRLPNQALAFADPRLTTWLCRLEARDPKRLASLSPNALPELG